MIKTVKSDKPVIVEFLDSEKNNCSGELLTYEIFGEACIRMQTGNVWVPFSKLTRPSKDKVYNSEFDPGTSTDTKQLQALNDPRIGIIVTLLVLIVFFYCSMKFNF